MNANRFRKSVVAGGAALGLLIQLERAGAVEIEPMGKALAALLGTSKVFRKVEKVNGKESVLYYSKDAGGKAEKLAFVEKGLYEPNCTHTWAIGIDRDTGTVTEVRVLEMSCPHAFPTKAASYLDQYKGKGPADVEKLDGQVTVIAKATGSSKLATEAVKRSIRAYWTHFKGKV